MCPNTCSSCSQTGVTSIYNQQQQIISRPFVANGEPNHKTSDIPQPLKAEQNIPQFQYNQSPMAINMPVPIPQKKQNYQPTIPTQQQNLIPPQQLLPQNIPSSNPFNLQNPFQLFQFPQLQTQQPFNPFQQFLNPAFLSTNNNQQTPQQQLISQPQNQIISQQQTLPQQQQFMTQPSGTQNYQGFNMVQPQVYKPLQTQTFPQQPYQQSNISPLTINNNNNNIMSQGQIQKPQPNPPFQQPYSPTPIRENHVEVNNQIPEQFKPRQIYNNQVDPQPSNIMPSTNSLANTNNIQLPQQSQQQFNIPKPPEYNYGQQHRQNGYQRVNEIPPQPQIPTMNTNQRPSPTIMVPSQPIKTPTIYPFAGEKNSPYQNIKHQCPKQPNWEPCIDKTLANERFKSCCSPLGEGCSQLCSYDQTLTTIQLAVLTGRCPMSKVGDMMVCASGYEDATPCCEAYGVFEPGFEQCRPYCNPAAGLPNDGMLAEKYKCLGKLSQIQRCFYATQRP
uniref:DB domain-containing protein n=1 Tax=Strongyloides papillosus TaxID=174720 RepID=A0A0N5CDZ8_STREA